MKIGHLCLLFSVLVKPLAYKKWNVPFCRYVIIRAWPAWSKNFGLSPDHIYGIGLLSCATSTSDSTSFKRSAAFNLLAPKLDSRSSYPLPTPLVGLKHVQVTWSPLSTHNILENSELTWNSKFEAFSLSTVSSWLTCNTLLLGLYACSNMARLPRRATHPMCYQSQPLQYPSLATDTKSPAVQSKTSHPLSTPSELGPCTQAQPLLPQASSTFFSHPPWLSSSNHPGPRPAVSNNQLDPPTFIRSRSECLL